MRRIVLIAAIVTLVAPNALVKLAVGAEPYTGCAPAGNIRFVCDRGGAEDIAPLQGTDWVVASAFSGAVGLQLISVHDEKVAAILYPSPDAKKKQDMATYGDCPGPLSAEEEAMFVSHGLAVKKVTNRSFTLYVVHHGGRESIEVFNLDVPTGTRPVVTWVGCAVTPDTAVLNAVAPLPDGGFVTTDSCDERNPDWKIPAALVAREIIGDPMSTSCAPGMREKRARGENTSYVLEWHPHSGWTKLPDSDGSGDNGIETSKDGKYVYVPMSGTTRLFRLTRGVNPPKRDEVDLGVTGLDNVKWSADGKKLLVGAHPAGKPGVGLAAEPTGKIIEIDPDTLQVTNLLETPFPATTGMEFGRDMWITYPLIFAIAIVPMPPVQR